LPKEIRRALVLNKAYEFFSEQGPSAKTRALAKHCGVSQRLLYSLFPNKAALLSAVYEVEISGPFKSTWFEQLINREIPVEQRLTRFYQEYYQAILTRKWLRFFLYASLQDVSIAPKYISSFVTQLVELIVKEVAIEKIMYPTQAGCICTRAWMAFTWKHFSSCYPPTNLSR
jgi:AcrR family transcriptional regulator